MQHISGADINISIGTQIISVKQYTLNIEDGIKPTTTRGVPDGFVRGAVSASGELTLDTDSYSKLIDAAKAAGSWQQLGVFDISGLGKTLDQEFKTKAYGCKLRLSKVLDAGSDGGDKLEHTIAYDVTDKRFVEINGVPYLDQSFVSTVV
ncbi:phage protein [Marinomonas sp. PE14-40]|uniref:phage protein n=1 Tax=Marinomonas sp. PE14-40 TaxID=3060621 RepID=UPI003F67E22F